MGKLDTLPGRLIPWYQSHARQLPWREDTDPYHVWISEIMLQQTRVEAVKNYYTRFLSALPDIAALARAPEALLLKLWEGLGYYSRVRNLARAAECIIAEHDGIFPSDYSSIRALPGIGDYTAGAIASICFSQCEPAVDGNVLRVIARFTGDSRCVDLNATKREIRNALKAVYPKDDPGTFTQALMELGAVVCLPNGTPLCPVCPLHQDCCAYLENRTRQLPVRKPKTARRIEQMTVFLISCGSEIAVRYRSDHGLLAGMWEFPNIPGPANPGSVSSALTELGIVPLEITPMLPASHIFTHVEWHMSVLRIRTETRSVFLEWADPDTIRTRYAIPTAFRQLLSRFDAASAGTD